MSIKKRSLKEVIVNIVLDIFIFIFGLLLLVSAYNMVQIKILGNDYSSFFGYSLFEVQTGSMSGEIEIGDWIVVKYTKTPQLNDIVTFKQDKDFITHRIVEAYKGTFVTQGKVNPTKDDPISQDQIIGKVVKILPSFGILRKTLFNPIVLLMIIVTLYLISFLFRKNEKSKQDLSERKLDVWIDKLINLCKKTITNIKQESKEVKKEDTVIKSIKHKKEKKIEKKAKDNRDSEKKVEKETVVEKQDVEKEMEKNQENNVQPVVTDENVVSKEIEPLNEQDAGESAETLNENAIEGIEPLNEEDLDKTMYFRMVSVDKFELDDTYLKIAENTMENSQNEVKVVSISEEDEVKDDDTFIKNNLEMLQKKRKKCKNIIEKIMLIKTEEITEIVNVLNFNDKMLTNEATIKGTFIKNYIDAKYYNYCGDINVEYNGKNMATRIEAVIKNTGDILMKQYKNSDIKYCDKVKKYVNMFMLVLHFEQANVLIDDLLVKKESYKNKILKYFKGQPITGVELKDMINKVVKIQRIYQGMVKYSLEKLNTNTFQLELDKVANKKMYLVSLQHNISFSKVYSDYIVDKTYSEGIIAEDKIGILNSLLSVRLVEDMLKGEFQNKYILHIPTSLYSKVNKINNVFDMLDDEYIKNNVIVLVTYDALIKNKKIIKSFIKDGYKFALCFDRAVNISDREHGNIGIMECLFVNKKKTDLKDMISSLPSDMQKNIIDEDVTNLLEVLGGE